MTEAKAETAARTRVLLADDHNLLRAGIRSLLEEMGDVEVVGEAADGPSALERAGRLRPEVMLVDISMPGLGGIDVAARLAQDCPEISVIVLSMHGDGEYVRRAALAGARGYLLKDSDVAELALAVRAVARGQTYFSPAASKHLLSEYLRQTASAEPEPAAELTPRQRDVLRLIAEGHGSKTIGRKLGISVKTVETHRGQLMDRLGIHEIASLVRYAIRVGLVEPS